MLTCKKCGAPRSPERKSYICTACNRQVQKQWRESRRAAGLPVKNKKRKEPRQIRIEGALAYVPLTQGLESIIDADCVDLVSGWNWSLQADRSGPYPSRSNFEGGVRKTLMMHHVIMPPSEGLQVDHINGNRLDNRKANLRLVTPSQNAMNRKVGQNSKSGVKGVRWCRVLSKWTAWITAHGKRTYLGSFHDIEEAAAAYARAAERLHGEFRRQA